MSTNNIKQIAEQVKKDYRNGWKVSANCGSLEAADARGVSGAWYDGYMDYACGRDKYHSLIHDITDCEVCSA